MKVSYEKKIREGEGMGKNMRTRGEGMKLCITLMKCTNVQHTYRPVGIKM